MGHVLDNLWQAFARAVAVRTTAPAILLGPDSISFAALRDDAERCAAWLDATGVKQGDVAVLQLPKRRETYAIWLACLRQGITYVFADPRNPPSRTAQILARLKPAILFSAGTSRNPHGKTVVLGDAVAGSAWLDELPRDGVPSPAAVTGDDPAYVMFTSGSTGEPKGAIIPHRGILSLMKWGRTICDPMSSRFSNLNPLHFDNSVFDLYCGLVNGATLVPVETASLPNPALWVRRLRDGGATVLFGVPTLFQTLDQLKLLTPSKLPDARLFVFGGEGYPVDALRAFRQSFAGQAALLNVYGPTETSCICSSLLVDETVLDEAKGKFPSLGRMHEDFFYAVLDSDGREVKRGVTGELWIGGQNVGLGYFGNEEDTAYRFRPDPRPGAEASIWYRSGDLVREDERAMLWFQGRVDNQVKIRGHRVELEEIDLAVEAIAHVTRAMSVTIDGDGGLEICVAFTATHELTQDEIIAHCVTALPPYMKPARTVQLPELPTNANGKVDRKAILRLLVGKSGVAP